jgi:hypothetical protein
MIDMMIVTVRPMKAGARASSGLPRLHPSVSEKMRNTSTKVPIPSAMKAVNGETTATPAAPGFG